MDRTNVINRPTWQNVNFKGRYVILFTQSFYDIWFSIKISLIWFGKISVDLKLIYKIPKFHISANQQSASEKIVFQEGRKKKRAWFPTLNSGKDIAEKTHEWPDQSAQNGHACELSEYN